MKLSVLLVKCVRVKEEKGGVSGVGTQKGKKKLRSKKGERERKCRWVSKGPLLIRTNNLFYFLLSFSLAPHQQHPAGCPSDPCLSQGASAHGRVLSSLLASPHARLCSNQQQLQLILVTPSCKLLYIRTVRMNTHGGLQKEWRHDGQTWRAFLGTMIPTITTAAAAAASMKQSETQLSNKVHHRYNNGLLTVAFWFLSLAVETH